MINTIIFDLGAVLIDWHPHHLYKKIFTDEAEMNHFLENICTSAWNEEQDAGRSIKDGTAHLVAKHPEYEDYIKAYYGRWSEMLGPGLTETAEILKSLKQSGKYKLYVLSNWSAETWPIARERYEFLDWFDGLVVSGHEGIRKPDPEFYNLLLARYNVNPSNALFIDDNYRNILAAEKLGIRSIHFTLPTQLAKDLEEVLGIEIK
jgi:2-haloacid dehalogenase